MSPAKIQQNGKLGRLIWEKIMELFHELAASSSSEQEEEEEEEVHVND
jgi:hypothetical protein